MRPFARRRPAPFWFQLAVACAVALACRAWLPAPSGPHAPQLAFWAIFLTVVEWIWHGVQAAGEATLASVAWSVRMVWSFAQNIYNATRTVASVLRDGFLNTWNFTKGLYESVLKPAWQHFWSVVDKIHATLERIFRPVIAFLDRVRAEFLKLYEHWVRPILDTIDTARKILHVLSALHLEFARRLDAELGRLEELIDRPFRFVLAKINEAINLVDRIVTADGLFQRLALVRSIARDFAVIGEEYGRWHQRPISAEELERRRKLEFVSADPHVFGQELGALYRGEASQIAGLARELAPDWLEALGIGKGSVRG